MRRELHLRLSASLNGSPVPVFRSILLVLALSLGGLSCRRQLPTSATKDRESSGPTGISGMADYVQDGEGDGCVWVVDSPSGGRLFLCGTIHILREQDYPLAPAYEAAYMFSDKLVYELPPDESTSAELPKKMAQFGMYSADASLDENISPQTWEKVNAWAKKHGLKASDLNRYRPWYVSLMLTATEYAALGATPNLGVDTHFEKRAREEGKPGEGLETADFQIQLFAALTKKQQSDLLDQTMGEMDVVAREYERMIKAWRYGRLDDLYKMLFAEADKYPDIVNLFLTARNIVWVDKLDLMLKKREKAMILVGAGHLAGPNGLIELMARRGHKVRHYREVKDF